MITFESLGLSGAILDALDKKGFSTPTPIQEQAIPVLLEGETDLIGRARTGTGKTAAFGLPILEKTEEQAGHVQALILAPTRELANQVSKELNELKGKKRLRISTFYGGQSIQDQLRLLKFGVDIVVGTPGRVLDLINRGRLDLSGISYFVLDEADEMLNMGFIEDVEQILKDANPERSTLFFSATMPPEIMRMATTYMKDHQVISAHSEKEEANLTTQVFYRVAEKDKFLALCRVIDVAEDFYGMVFCRTKRDADRLGARLAEKGYAADALHGDLSQAVREKILYKFRQKTINILVATDVAARGIDVSGLTHVINFSLPQDPESYVHRIGRTGRAGNEGTAVSLVMPSEMGKLNYIQRMARTRIEKGTLPSVDDLIELKKKRLHDGLEAAMQSPASDAYAETARELLEGADPENVVASLLALAFKNELNADAYPEIEEAEDRYSGQARLRIGLGRKDGISPRKLLNFLKNNAGVRGNDIQGISIMDSFSFFSAPGRQAERILKQFSGRTKGHRPFVERALPRKGGPSNRPYNKPYGKPYNKQHNKPYNRPKRDNSVA